MTDQRTLKRIIAEQREEIKQLKALVYCTCEKPASNKFGMDNMCAKCIKPIENHPLTISGKEIK